jgi:4'-phosphopantetheinyl transferase
MSIFWYEQSASDVPVSNSWLSRRERAFLATLRFAKRRDEWRLGRWTAKCAVAASLGLSSEVIHLSEIEIWPSRSGAPVAFLGHDQAHVTISLSHRSGHAICVVAPSIAHIGCDLELVEPREASFVGDYFATDEQALVACTSRDKRDQVVTLLWSAKESALKALRLGLRLDTRRLEVSLREVLPADESKFWLDSYPIRLARLESAEEETSTDVWHPFQVRLKDVPAFVGRWRNPDQFVRTVIIRHPSVSQLEESAEGYTRPEQILAS